MNNVNYFEDLFESIPDYRKIVILMFLINNDVNLLYECGFLKGEIHNLYKKFKKILLELNEEYLDHFKYQEESLLETFLYGSKWNNTLIAFLKMFVMNDR